MPEVSDNKNSGLQQEEDVYIPGVCNIGKEEMMMRRRTAVVTSVFALLTIVLIQVLHLSHLWRLLVFVPAASAAVGIQQVYLKFCINFGFRGVYNFGKLGTVHSAEMKEFIKQDKDKAMRMLLIAIVAGAIVAGVYYVLPL